MTNTNPPPLTNQKARSIKGFGENISQPSLYINISRLYFSLLNMISQEVLSPFNLSHYFVEDWIFGYRDGIGVIAHKGNSLKPHSKVSHGVHNP
jgi:hypothetical protein